jgi:nitrogen fixation protein FixH
MNERTKREATRRGTFWAMSPVLLLGGLLGMQVTFLGWALGDPSFAVEEDYYQKAVSWDVKMAQDRENARLGWSMDLEVHGFGDDAKLRLELRDEAGAAIDDAEVVVQAFPNARAGRIREVTPRALGEGVYEGPLFVERGGLWEFRSVASRGQTRFTAVLRRDLVGGGGT